MRIVPQATPVNMALRAILLVAVLATAVPFVFTQRNTCPIMEDTAVVWCVQSHLPAIPVPPATTQHTSQRSHAAHIRLEFLVVLFFFLCT